MWYTLGFLEAVSRSYYANCQTFLFTALLNAIQNYMSVKKLWILNASERAYEPILIDQYYSN